jgi:phosphate starvation-inducible PhoH-like protein/PhoH-like ATPase|tara:strand:+ start:611 stop:1312 length:702 start_codon:yes stop_codon:yes gene_type:complete
MAKAKDIRIDNMVTVSPVTDNQKIAFQDYKAGKNLFLYGAAGTGKTFITLYLALQEALRNETKYDTVYIVRSAVPTREIGFLPGDEEDKTALFQVPYQNMVKFMFEQPNEQAFAMLYDRLKNQNSLMFLTTSFLRGITLDNAIIIVDEAQNLTFHELDTIITRVGMDSKIMFCGDFFQSDLQKHIDKEGIKHFMKILKGMKSFSNIEFTLGDIVRSGMVKEYLISKIKAEENG